ncbi:MAG: uracil-DNA glycosylase [Myxococcaceae bacterium]
MSDNHAELASIVDDVKRHLAWQREEAGRSSPVSLNATPHWVWIERASKTQPVVPPARMSPPVGTAAAASASPAAASSADSSAEPRARRALDEVRIELGDCKRCGLCTTRQKIVFGVGNPRAELVFVGEGPGADEDAQGLPFVGKAGQLLTKMIEAMGFGRDDVYICNVVKCRPPGNRNPEPEEIEACEPFLKAQLDSVRPKVIVALGKFAAQTLLREETAISRLRGKWREYEGIPLMPTFHPAYLLRSPEEKKHAWSDLKQVMTRLGKQPKET